MKRKRQIALSSFLTDQKPANIKTVCLSGKGITIADQVSPFIRSEVESLDLSNNKLFEVGSLVQFIKLKELNLSSNKIGNSKELLKLRGIGALRKISFSNNPFLHEPIDEEFLQFIIEKETDIEVLSFDLIQEVQNQEIKIIFLKNYLSKIDLHQELTKKDKAKTPPSRIKPESLVNKIIPQFYTSISTPKLTSTIKKEALSLKKSQSQNSFEQALGRSKRMKVKQVDQLIETILSIIHESDTFQQSNSFMLEVNISDNTITFSPQRNNRSKGKSKQKDHQRLKTEERNKVNPHLLGQNYSPLREKEKSRYRTPISKNEASPSSRKKDYIKVVEDQQTDLKFLTRSPDIRLSPSLSTIKGDRSKVSDQSIYLMNQQLTPDKIQTIYFKTLNKVHPMFSLLHSPACSLKNEEKNVILQALKVSHRDNFTQLVKERLSNQNLMKELDLFEAETEQKLEWFEKDNRQLVQNCQAKIQEVQWTQKRYRALKDDYNLIFQQAKELKNSEKNKQATLFSMEEAFKKMKDSYMETKQTLQVVKFSEEKEDIISQNHEEILLQKYFNKLTSRASLWKKVICKQKKAKEKRNRELLNWGMESFIAAGLFRLKMNKFSKKKNQLIMGNYFKNWLFQLKLSKKEKNTVRKLKKKMVNSFIQLLRKNEAESKMAKLRLIWALSFYKDRKCKKSVFLWKRLVTQRRQKGNQAILMSNIKNYRLFFVGWKAVIAKRKILVKQIGDHHQQLVIKKQSRRLLWGMKKELVDNREKEHTVRTCHQLELRKRSWVFFQKVMRSKITQKKRFVIMNKWIVQKAMFNFKKGFNKNTTLKKNIQYKIGRINYLIISKKLKREKNAIECEQMLLVHLMKGFLGALQRHQQLQSKFKISKNHLFNINMVKYKSYQLRLIKQLQVNRLKGRNYVKRRSIEQMNFQMDLNDNQAMQLIRQGQHSINRCESQIHFLKHQIQNQSARQMALLAEKDAMMLTLNESHEIMVELGKEVTFIREESSQQQKSYNNLVSQYNEVVSLLKDKKQKGLQSKKGEGRKQ